MGVRKKIKKISLSKHPRILGARAGTHGSVFARKARPEHVRQGEFDPLTDVKVQYVSLAPKLVDHLAKGEERGFERGKKDCTLRA
jgi:hypothetical protein